MACNRETSADGSTSSAPPSCQTPDSLVPCCNTNCHFFGRAATMNLCSKCYSEHVLKEGGPVFLNKPCDATVADPPIVRLNTDGPGEANNPCVAVHDSSAQRIEDASMPMSGSMVAMSANESGLRELLSSKGKSMNRSVGVSDLHAIFRSVETCDMSGSSSDSLQQRMPSPLSLPSSSPCAFSPVRRQPQTKLSVPPLPPRQQAVNRCLTCRKRVGLLGFKCRCGDIFCSLHRYSDKHNCSFDYKAAGRAAIAKENPVVKATKIEKI